MPIDVDRIETDAALPARADVVIIGGGIVGVGAALALARRGISTVLCEKGWVGAEQSGRNWGWVRAMGRDVAEIPLALESQRMWGELNAACEAETGFRRCGILYLCETEKEMARHEAWLEQARPYQLTSRRVVREGLDAVLPGASRSFVGGFHTPTDGRAEPDQAAPAMAAAARRHGATIIEGCAARGLDVAAGRVAGVVTEKGRIACGSVILAGGAWSRLLLGNAGIDLPQLKMLGSVLATTPMDGGPEITAGGADFAFRKRLDGGYSVARRNSSIAHITPDSFRLFFDFFPALITGWDELRLRPRGRFLEEWRMPRRWSLDAASPFEAVRVLDPAPDAPTLEHARARLGTVFPFFKDAKVARSWGGLIDVTPDAVPVISPVDALPGLIIATGFSGHGFGIGPAAGRLAADLATGAPPVVDPTPFRFARFRRGRSMAR